MTDSKVAGPFSGLCREKSADENDISCIDGRETKLGKPSLLLNSCCGPCSTAVIERLAPDYDITVFFYNPNITDEEEYRKRLKNQIKFIREFNRDPSIPYSVKFLEALTNLRSITRCVKSIHRSLKAGEDAVSVSFSDWRRQRRLRPCAILTRSGLR